MSLPAWWQVVTPHKDIREKSFSEAVFAADLGDVLSGTAPQEYGDPRLFFEKTYITAGLANLVRNVLSRLTTGQGDPVIQLQTPFGGGKTHSLLTLYHLVNSFDHVSHLSQVQEMVAGRRLLGTRVAAFVGTSADPVKGRTPWGEIAYQFGCYEIVKEHDERRVAPGKERIKEILQKSGPTLILIDELLQYVVKANRVEKVDKITQGQTLAFLQELSEAVATSDRSVLVLTLPASILEQYDEEAEKALSQMQKVSGRLESIYVPVDGMELYEVIRKRLFEDYGDSRLHRQVAEWYFKSYQGLGSDVPSEVKEVAYRDKIERAYPFHPEFIDVLYERWGSFPTFQRTRGVLRLLAQVVGDLYERKVSGPLIHSSMVDLSHPAVRREFIKHIGNEYDSIIAADIAGKARRIDREMGSEYEKYSIANGLATSIFLHSFSGGERRGATLPWLRVSLLREGIPSTIVGDAVSKLEDSLWYFHKEKRSYSFKNQPNLNRIIVDKEDAIEPEQVQNTLREYLSKLSKGAPFDAYLWPKASGDVPDHRRLKLVLLGLDLKHGQNETDRLAKELIDNAGSSFRIYRNTIFIMALDPGAYINLEKQLRRFLALKEISGDTSIILTPDARGELQTRLKQLEDDLPFQVVATYRHVAWYSTGGLVWHDMGLPTVGESSSIAKRVFQYLKDEERILASLTPKLILDKAFGDGEIEKSLQEIYDIFLKTPGLPCLENETVLIEAAKQGTRSGLLGLRIDGTLYFEESPPDPPMEALLLPPARAAEEKKASWEASYAPGDTTSASSYKGIVPIRPGNVMDGAEDKKVTVEGEPLQPAQSRVKRVAIKAAIPWDKLSQIVTGVIRPLKALGSDPEIVIEIKAEAENGFDRTTLDSKVRETLLQLGSNIVEWKEN
ncbi:MAG: ATP-binding protein [Firmicutes bacterium]|nr:ATP-binding protein [Bacillota bacterium]